MGQGSHELANGSDNESDRESMVDGQGDEIAYRPKGREDNLRDNFDERINGVFQNRLPLNPNRVTLKPDPYTGKDCWEAYLFHFADIGELGRWDNRTKLLFLAASLKYQVRTYYMS